MRKALVNYWVDLVTGAAFIFCAVTGIVFLFPGAVHATIGSTPTILLIPATWWHSVHDWTGVVMVAGTALHLALHAKWITTMTRRTFGAQTEAANSRSGRPARVAGAALQPAGSAASVAVAARKPTLLSDAEEDAAASLRRLEGLRDERRRDHEQRISRRRLLTGAAVVGGAALLASVGLIGRDAVSGASTRLRDDGWTSGGGGQADTSSSAASGSGNGAGSSNGNSGGASAAQSDASGSSNSTRVVVNEAACVACGRCLQVCPVGVFDWSSSGRAQATNADACIRCGKCLQVCPAGAITVSA